MTDVRGVVVAHAGLAQALVDAAERISGLEGILAAISNDGVTPADLQQRVLEEIGSGPGILFTDMASGSCTFACRAASRAHLSPLHVVTGVNLSMLIDFLFNRNLAPAELANRVVEKGRAGATVILAEGVPGGT